MGGFEIGIQSFMRWNELHYDNLNAFDLAEFPSIHAVGTRIDKISGN